jgi:hypothetical protein
MKPLKVSQEELDAIVDKYQVDDSTVRGFLARIPPSWTLIEKGHDGAAFKRGNLQVIAGISYELDHKIWIHVSACGRRSETSFFLPSWEDMKRVKHDFIGPARWAYQVFPSESDYINQNPYVLHLFALLEGEPALPDFTKGTGSI